MMSPTDSGDTPVQRLHRSSPVHRFIGLCLRNKLVVGVLTLIAIGWGVGVAPFPWDAWGLPRSPVPVDAIPDIGENQQIIFTEWTGRSPQDVEDQITYPLTVSLLGIPGVQSIRGYSMFGFSTVYVIFKEDVEFYWSRTRLLEKLSSLPTDMLPAEVRPILGPDSTSLGQVFWYTLEGVDANGRPTGGWDLQELRTIQDWTVRYALLSAEGVSEVASVGGFVQEYQVDVDPDALKSYDVTLEDVFEAVKSSNIDVGARTIEVNKVEYLIRSLGFVKELADIENAVVKVGQSVPISVKNLARVTRGPAFRRGLLDKEGAEAVGGVVVARYGSNPLKVIESVRRKIAEISAGLPRKRLPDGTVSQVRIVPFYDRSGLIHETLGTLNTALTQEILITIIVVVVMLMHLRSSLVISGLLPLAVLMCFIAMKAAKVDANVVALSGIAIAIGTIVDMGVIVSENILRRLDEAAPGANRLEVIHHAASEVGSAVVTAVSTTVVSFLPVFTMHAAEGKLFRPLAYTKTFALIASILIALALIPPAAHLLYDRRVGRSSLRTLLHALLAAGGVVIAVMTSWWWAGAIIAAIGAHHLLVDRLPRVMGRRVAWLTNGVVVVTVIGVLAHRWLPLGAERGLSQNILFVVLLLGGLLVLFRLFELAYPSILRWCLAHKATFLAIPSVFVLAGLYIWLGPAAILGPIERAPAELFETPDAVERLVDKGLLERRDDGLLWSDHALAKRPEAFRAAVAEAGVAEGGAVLSDWAASRNLRDLRGRRWEEPDRIRDAALTTRILWTLARDWNGTGKEFMPPLDEGSYLYMPVTMPHASIGEVKDVLRKQDMAIRRIPEVDSVVGKLGRVESPLDPAPISMIETVINYKPEYFLDERGKRQFYRFRPNETDLFRDVDGTPIPAPDGKPYFVRTRFERDPDGRLIADPRGRPFRLWRPALDPAINPGRRPWSGILRPHHHAEAGLAFGPPDTIWDAIVEAARMPGTTMAPRLQPISARIVMLQSGMRAPMGVKIKGPTLEAIERVGLQIEHLLKEVPAVEPSAVIADRIISKPYLEIEIDREAIARYGIKLQNLQDVIEVAVGGKPITKTVEGRERFPVRVRYLREFRDSVEALGRILVEGHDDASMQLPVKMQIPLAQLAHIHYVRGPQVIKSEDTFLVGYVLFDKRDGYAEVEAVDQAREHLSHKLATGELELPAGVSYTFAGSYENQVRSEKTLMVVLPLALLIIFIILYLQFRSVGTTAIVFSGIAVAWSGGFIMIWLYSQPWFLDFSVLGTNMRDLFQVHPINLSVAVWVGFLALFGIATDDGVVMATYLKQSFSSARPRGREAVRAATIAAGRRRVRPCLMTTATTLLALIPILTSTGRGSDIMVPMAIPSFGGMVFELMTMLVVPTLYCRVQESRLPARSGRIAPAV